MDIFVPLGATFSVLRRWPFLCTFLAYFDKHAPLSPCVSVASLYYTYRIFDSFNLLPKLCLQHILTLKTFMHKIATLIKLQCIYSYERNHRYVKIHANSAPHAKEARFKTATRTCSKQIASL